MNTNNTVADVKRLVDRGYTAEDLHAIGIFSRDAINEVLEQQSADIARAEQHKHVHSQARFAWRMKRYG